MLSVLIPKNGEKVYRIAGEVFRDMYEKVTGITLPVVTEPADGDMVIIGSDSLTAALIPTTSATARTITGSYR